MYDDNEFESGDDFTIPCPNCGEQIFDDTPMCPKCHEYIVDNDRGVWSNKPSWFARTAVVLVVLTIIAFALPWILTLLGLIGAR